MTPDDRSMDERTRRRWDEERARYRRALDALPPGAASAAAEYDRHLARLNEIVRGPVPVARPARRAWKAPPEIPDAEFTDAPPAHAHDGGAFAPHSGQLSGVARRS